MGLRIVLGLLLLAGIGGGYFYYDANLTDKAVCRTYGSQDLEKVLAACARLANAAGTDRNRIAGAYATRAWHLGRRDDRRGEALADAEKALALVPEHHIAQEQKGDMLLKLGRHEEAINYWIGIMERSGHARIRLGDACDPGKDIPSRQVISACDVMIPDRRARMSSSEQAGRDLVRYLMRRSKLREEARDFAGAIKDLDEILAVRPSAPFIRLRKAHLLGDAGRRTEAMAMLEAIDKDNAQPLGLSSRELGELNKEREQARVELDKLQPAVPISAGVIWQKRGLRGLAPFRIVARSGSNFYMKVVDAGSGEQIMILFVPAGRTIETKMPLGTFKVRYAAGQTWRGDKLLFGRSTSYAVLDSSFDFRETAQGYSGFTVELIAQVGGNLREAPIAADKF